MLRQKLVEVLATVQPALSTKDAIPILTMFWFTGKQVLAFNDGIAISTKLETEWKAAVPGVLIKLLQASLASDLDITLQRDRELFIKAAAAKIKLPILPAEDFVFTMPALAKTETPSISGDNIWPFLDAVTFAVQCVASEASVPEQLGVNLLAKSKDSASVYATNEKSLFYTKVKTDKALPKRVILSEEFCKQMLTLYHTDVPATLYIREDSAIFKTGDVTLFGKLIHSENPLDFDGVLDRHFPDLTKNPKLSDVPSKMKMIIDRACIIMGNGGNTEAMVKEGTIHFRSHDPRTDRGVADVMKIGAEQKDLIIKFSPSLAKIALDAGLDRIRLTKNCVIFNRGELVFLVTTKSS
jgi:hypothetical protein